MEDNITKIFKICAQNIKISESFRIQSLEKIKSAARKIDAPLPKLKNRFAWSPFVIGFAGFLIVALGTFTYWKINLIGNENANQKTLQAEAQGLEFKIELKEAQYFTKYASEIATI